MSAFMWLLLGGVVIGIVSLLAKRRSFQKLPDLNDGEFVRVYKQGFDGDDSAVIRERKFIAKILGVPHWKLRTNHRLKELSKLHFDAGFEVGMSDIEDTLIQLRRHAGIEAPSGFAETVSSHWLSSERSLAMKSKRVDCRGDIHEMARARRESLSLEVWETMNSCTSLKVA